MDSSKQIQPNDASSVLISKVGVKIDVKAITFPKIKLKAKMSWTPWSEKSKDIPFKATKTGVGDGEDKVAAEMETRTLGQNSPYDMEFVYNGTLTKFDVKKLDAQDDFNTGKKGRDALRPLKHLHTNLLISIATLSESTLFTPDEQGLLNQLHDVSPDELAVGTLKKLCSICEMLHLKEKALRATLPSIPFNALSYKKDMPLDLFYYNCQKLSIAFPEEYSDYEATIQVLQKMDHIYIRHPKQLMEDLNALVQKVFTEVKPIVVDNDKGYMILKDVFQIQFYRITRGHPRFKVIF